MDLLLSTIERWSGKGLPLSGIFCANLCLSLKQRASRNAEDRKKHWQELKPGQYVEYSFHTAG